MKQTLTTSQLLLYLSLIIPGIMEIPGNSDIVHAQSSCLSNTFYGSRCKCLIDSNHGYNCGIHDQMIAVLCENIMDIDGLPDEGEATLDITCLIIDNLNITTLDRNTMSRFPNLRGLHIMKSGLARITNDAFDVVPALEYLVLSDNILTILPPLHSLRSLLELYVDKNRIKSMVAEDFSTVSNIRKVIANGNEVTALRNHVFANKCDLTEIDLSNNPLTIMEDNCLEGTPVIMLNLANTEIDRVPVTDSVRSHLTKLHLKETYNLKHFNAYESGAKFFNQTFPLLDTVQFAYHAHCCQLQIGKDGESHHYYIFKSFVTSGRRAATLLSKAISYFLPRGRVIRQAPELQYVCVNVTSSQCVDSSNFNISDRSIASVCELESLCNSVSLCPNCLEGICANGCAVVANSTVNGCANSTNSTVDTESSPSIVCALLPLLTTNFTTTPPDPAPVSSPSESTPPIQITPTSTQTTPISTQTMPTSTVANQEPPASSVLLTSPTPFLTTTTSTPTTPTTTVITPSIPYVCRSDFCAAISTTSNRRGLCEACQGACDQLGCMRYNSYPGFCGCFTVASIPDCLASERFSSVVTRDTCSVGSSSAPSTTPTDSESSCTVEVTCTVCSSWLDGLPADGVWFYPNASNTDLICTENSNIVTTLPTTESPTTGDPVTLPVNGSVVPCTLNDLSHYAKKNLTRCSPVPDVFNPCTDLLNEDHYLRVCIWFVIFFAFFGNGMVIVVFVVYTCIIRRTRMDLYVIHFLYFNLAVADFVMCIYLLTIASEDLRTLGEFSLHDIEWRTGSGCSFAGFCAILSTVMSVYVLTVITLERAYTLLKAMHKRNITKTTAMILMLIGWAISLLMATLPLPGVGVSDYSSVAICLPFNVQTDLAKSYVVFLLLATGVAFFVIAVTYIVIFTSIFCRRTLAYQGNNKRMTEIKVAIRMFVLVFTNFICWFPIALVGLSSALGDEGIVPDIQFAKWAIVFILPINSCFNPILYSISSKAFRENLVILLSKIKLCRGKATQILQRRAGITPSNVSHNTSGISHRRTQRVTLIQRLRLLSVSSQGSTDLSNRRYSNNLSDAEMYKMTILDTGRRSSGFSNGSNASSDEPLYNPKDRRKSVGSLPENTNVIFNPTFRSTSPVDAASLENKSVRTGAKSSASSLGPLMEEGESIVPPTIDPGVTKFNPTFVDDEQDGNLRTAGEVSRSDSVLSREDSDITLSGGTVTVSGGVGSHNQHQINTTVEESLHTSGEEDSGNNSENISGSPSVNEFLENQPAALEPN